jgi:hypothetical protein
MQVVGKLAQIIGELVWLQIRRRGIDDLRIAGQGA